MHCKCFICSDRNYANSAMDRNNVSPTSLHVAQTEKGAMIQCGHFATLYNSSVGQQPDCLSCGLRKEW